MKKFNHEIDEDFSRLLEDISFNEKKYNPLE